MGAHDPAPRAFAVVMLLALVRQVDARVLAAVAEREHRVDALLDLLDLAAQHAAVERDAVVGGAEILLGAVGDRALRDHAIMSWPSMLSRMYSPSASLNGTS